MDEVMSLLIRAIGPVDPASLVSILPLSLDWLID